MARYSECACVRTGSGRGPRAGSPRGVEDATGSDEAASKTSLLLFSLVEW